MFTFSIIPQSDVPLWPHITNVNSLLSDIYNRYVAIKREEFSRHYKVFDRVFNELHRTMKEVDKYYGRFASDVSYKYYYLFKRPSCRGCTVSTRRRSSVQFPLGEIFLPKITLISFQSKRRV